MADADWKKRLGYDSDSSSDDNDNDEWWFKKYIYISNTQFLMSKTNQNKFIWRKHSKEWESERERERKLEHKIIKMGQWNHINQNSLQ